MHFLALGAELIFLNYCFRYRKAGLEDAWDNTRKESKYLGSGRWPDTDALEEALKLLEMSERKKIMDKYVIKEQIYHDLETGNISQIRQEMSDGSIEWERPDGSIWNGPLHDLVSHCIKGISIRP